MIHRLSTRFPLPIFGLLLTLALGACTGTGSGRRDGTAAPPAVDEERAAPAPAPQPEPPPPPETPPAPLVLAQWTGQFQPAWKEVAKLQGEQKYEAAAKQIEDILAAAKTAGNGEEQVKALIQLVQMRTALHGYETSVRMLREQPWPEDLLGYTAMRLYYGAALVNYGHAYSWEIQQRERVEAKGPVDLKAWTMEQIFAEALRAAGELWWHREALGQLTTEPLKEYIQANTYPAGIRPSLRDAASYLLVDTLGDTTGWTPEQNNEIFQLDLGELLADGQPAVGAAWLTDRTRHPLKKIVAVLGDLEAWHTAAGQSEAAYEARLVRLQRLHASFTQAPDRERIRADLEQRLTTVAGKPWWAMGKALLAEFVQQQTDAPDALVRARAIAQEGQQAFPDSPGGQRCRHIVAAIEAPAYQLQGMRSDAPGRRSAAVSYKNLTRLYLRAYPYDLERRIAKADDYNLFPNYRELRRMVDAERPTHRWSMALEPTTDYQMHKQVIEPPMTRPGAYVVIASAREDFGRHHNQVTGLHMVIGDLVILSQQEQNSLEARVLSGASGKPVTGASVRLYKYDWRNHHRPVGEKVTGADGAVRFEQQDRGQQYFLLAKKGGQVALDPDHLYFWSNPPPSKRPATLLFTDRSIYRPLQKVLFKAVVYQGDRQLGQLQTAPGHKLVVTLRDGNNQEVDKRELVTNGFGTASGEFLLPAGRLLGQWQLRAAPEGYTPIRVEEYKRPTFEVKLLDPPQALRLNKPATLKGEARYYFGLPVASGGVRWRVNRTPVYPWWWNWYWWGAGPSTQPQMVATGSAALRDDGTFELAFTPAADERLGATQKSISYRYEVSADVTDEGGETRSASRGFRLGFVAVEAMVQSDVNFHLEGQPVAMTILRTDLDGTPVSGTGNWRVLALQAPPHALLPADQPLPETPPDRPKPLLVTAGDRVRPRWNPGYSPFSVIAGWADGAERASGELKHDEKGKAALSIPALPGGVYRLRYNTRDAFGAEYQMHKDFLVAGPQTRLPLPALLLAERNSVKVGETARLLVISGLADQPLTLDLARDGKRFDRREFVAGRAPAILELPMTERDRGGFALILSGVRDHQWLNSQLAVHVPWDDKALKLEFSTFRDQMRPGTRETFQVKVTGPAGADTAVAAAELLAYMYDRSLDAFVPHQPASIAGLYPYRASAGTTRSSLGMAQQAWLDSDGFGGLPGYPHLQPDQLRFPSGYGIGGPGYRGRGPMRRLSRSLDGAVAADEEVSLAESAAAPAPQAPTESRREAKGRGDIGLLGGALKKSGDKDSRDLPAADDAGIGANAAPVEMRSDFSETAFFQPHLLTGADGSATLEFQVPDSVTSWSVWVHAVTRDLKGGSVQKDTRTVKELMVRPYLPRFLREGDQAQLKVVVNNASEAELKGELVFDILDPETERSLLADFGLDAAHARAAFTAPVGGGTNLTFPVTTPARVGLVAFKVVARSGDFSDGELRPIPLLPGRYHLIQSRFVSLRDRDRREMTFQDMKADDDPTRIDDQLVVTIDAQLFYAVLSALPYLVNYPYECTEQTMNRFLSTGILSSLYKQYPAVARMAEKFSKRETRLEDWSADDPNRKMALEETPWVQQAKGGEEVDADLIKVLDPKIARAQREASLAKLRKAQTSSGGFPWFPGGPPSPYITLYLLHGFSKALEFGVDVPRDVVQRAWSYVHRHYLDELVRIMMSLDCCWEFITFLNYTLSNFPDPSWIGGVFSEAERKQMLDFSFRHWKQHAPYLKGYLALTLHRAGRQANAKLVWESVMDSAKTAQDQGTFWAPEDRGWLWYNDTIETHAFAIRTLLELMPDDPKLDGLVLWLFINKKLNHWKSTRATAEVIYSLAHYLKKTGGLGVREAVSVSVGDHRQEFAFEPDEYTGKKNQIVIPGAEIDPKKDHTVVLEKETKGFMLASATWHFSTERLPPEARGDYLAVERSYFKRSRKGKETILEPLAEGVALEPGDEVEVQLSIRSKHAMEYVHLRDPRPAGFEPVSQISRHKWDLGIYWYEEVRDSGNNFFFERLPVGEYTFKYRLRAAIAGVYKAAPATIQPMYAPEFAAYSAGGLMTIQAVAK